MSGSETLGRRETMLLFVARAARSEIGDRQAPVVEEHSTQGRARVRRGVVIRCRIPEWREDLARADRNLRHDELGVVVDEGGGRQVRRARFGKGRGDGEDVLAYAPEAVVREQPDEHRAVRGE